MNRRTLAVALVLLGMPAIVALIEAVSFARSNANTGILVSSDREREYLLHVPATYNASRPTPLVISLHAAAVWPAVQRDISGWNAVADDHGFLVVYPSGLSTGEPRIWRMAGPEMQRDVTFIADLIDDLRRRYNIDPSRIYADGLSNGGGMAFVLSCTMRDRIAAVAMVGAALLVPFESCADARPVPMIAFHGTADTAAPYYGGPSWVTSIPLQDVPAFVAKWAKRNRCAASREEPRLTPDVSRLTYHECAGGADVVFHTVYDGGHTWPGGGAVPKWFAGRTTSSINATRELWSFFEAHGRRGRDSFLPSERP
jgi:polyhydroxybutyrate depolymerase